MNITRTVLALVLSIVAGSALAQWPTKPIRFVIPFPPGTAADLVARVIGQSVSQAVGQPVIVEAKPGADGAIGTMDVIRSAPDGYTWLLASPGPIAAVPALRKDPPYDPIVDLTPIADVGRYTLFLYVHPTLPANTFSELVSYAKANPGKLAYATGNTSGIVSFAQMNALAGIDMLQVPYKGEPAGIGDLVQNRVQLMWATPTTGLAFVKEGKLRVLATALKQRSSLLPDVPTINEAGLPTFSIISFAAIYGPAKMPRDLTERINKELVAAMKRPEVVAVMDKHAIVLTPSTPDELTVFTKQQVDDYRRVLRAAGVQPN